MKTIHFLSVTFLFVLLSCNSKEKTNTPKVSFGIYETVKVKDMPVSITDELKKTTIGLQKNPQLPIVGYFTKNDSFNIRTDFPEHGIKLAKTNFIAEGKYYALVALKSKPVIINDDIKEAKGNNHTIIIYFNLEGARKWAGMTRNNIGNSVAFTIDDKIYTMPLVNSEIRDGVAIIDHIESDSVAKRLSASIK